MPVFYEEAEFDMDPRDFLEECSPREIEEIIYHLEEMGHLSKIRNEHSVGSVLELEFQKMVEKIASSRLRLTNEEEEVLRKISDRL
jgi:hypothetical protein